jgi:hypothetical protein
MCCGISSPALYRHWADCIPDTLRLYKTFASPIGPVRACTSTELFAFWSHKWSFSTALFGGVSSGIARLPGSVLGYATCSSLLGSASHLFVQSASTSGFSRSSHCSIGWPIHFSTHCLRTLAGVAGIGSCRCRCLQVRSCIQIAALLYRIGQLAELANFALLLTPIGQYWPHWSQIDQYYEI